MNEVASFSNGAADDLPIIEKTDIMNLDRRVQYFDDLIISYSPYGRWCPHRNTTHCEGSTVMPVEDNDSCSHPDSSIKSFAFCRTASISFKRKDSCEPSGVESNFTRSQFIRVCRACVCYEYRNSVMTCIGMLGRMTDLIAIRNCTKSQGNALAAFMAESIRLAFSSSSHWSS